MKQNLRTFSLVVSGVLTQIMTLFIPIAGGGASLIFILSIPVFTFLGILSGIGHWHISQKSKNKNVQHITFIILLTILIGLALFFYPYGF